MLARCNPNRSMPASRRRSSNSAVAVTNTMVSLSPGGTSAVAAQPAHVGERPDAHERPPHHVGAVDRAEGAGVLGVDAVVAHHVELAGPHGDGLAPLGGDAGGQVRLVDD